MKGIPKGAPHEVMTENSHIIGVWHVDVDAGDSLLICWRNHPSDKLIQLIATSSHKGEMKVRRAEIEGTDEDAIRECRLILEEVAKVAHGYNREEHLINGGVRELRKRNLPWCFIVEVPVQPPTTIFGQRVPVADC